LAPKLKGIVSQSVKDVLQSLLDDGLVQMDKIGASNFYWSFPSRHGAGLKANLSKASEVMDGLTQQLHDLKTSIDMAKRVALKRIQGSEIWMRWNLTRMYSGHWTVSFVSTVLVTLRKWKKNNEPSCWPEKPPSGGLTITPLQWHISASIMELTAMTYASTSV